MQCLAVLHPLNLDLDLLTSGDYCTEGRRSTPWISTNYRTCRRGPPIPRQIAHVPTFCSCTRFCKGHMCLHSSLSPLTHILSFGERGTCSLIWRWVWCLPIQQHPTSISWTIWWSKSCIFRRNYQTYRQRPAKSRQIMYFRIHEILRASHVRKSYFCTRVHGYEQPSWSPRRCYCRNSLNPWKFSHGSFSYSFPISDVFEKPDRQQPSGLALRLALQLL